MAEANKSSSRNLPAVGIGTSKTARSMNDDSHVSLRLPGVADHHMHRDHVLLPEPSQPSPMAPVLPQGTAPKAGLVRKFLQQKFQLREASGGGLVRGALREVSEQTQSAPPQEPTRDDIERNPFKEVDFHASGNLMRASDVGSTLFSMVQQGAAAHVRQIQTLSQNCGVKEALTVVSISAVESRYCRKLHQNLAAELIRAVQAGDKQLLRLVLDCLSCDQIWAIVTVVETEAASSQLQEDELEKYYRCVSQLDTHAGQREASMKVNAGEWLSGGSRLPDLFFKATKSLCIGGVLDLLAQVAIEVKGASLVLTKGHAAAEAGCMHLGQSQMSRLRQYVPEAFKSQDTLVRYVSRLQWEIPSRISQLWIKPSPTDLANWI